MIWTIDELIDRWVDQKMNWPVHRFSIDQLINKWTDQQMNWSIYELITRWIDH